MTSPRRSSKELHVDEGFDGIVGSSKHLPPRRYRLALTVVLVCHNLWRPDELAPAQTRSRHDMRQAGRWHNPGMTAGDAR
jgi:hypothetical protein